MWFFLSVFMCAFTQVNNGTEVRRGWCTGWRATAPYWSVSRGHFKPGSSGSSRLGMREWRWVWGNFTWGRNQPKHLYMMCCTINSWENLPLPLHSGSRWWAHRRDVSRASVFTSEKLWRWRVRVSDSGAWIRAHLIANRSSRPGRREGEVGDPQGQRRGWEARPQLPPLYNPPAGPEHQPQDSGAVLRAGSPFQALVQRFPPAHRLRGRAESGRVLRESLVLQQKTQEEQTQIFFGWGEERERESRRELPQGSQTHLGHLRRTHTGQYYYTQTHIWYKGQTHAVQHALTLLWTWAVKKDQQVISVLQWHPLTTYILTFPCN